MVNVPDYVLYKVLAACKILNFKGKYAIGVDWTVTADKHRLFQIDVQNEECVYSWFTSHGQGSGQLEKALHFSNIPNSHMSSLGLMKTAEVYYSSKFNGNSLRLDGIQKGVNDNVRARAIVMHPSEYVNQIYMKRNKYPGRSHGCITLDPLESNRLINDIKGGSPVVNIDRK